MKYGLTRVVFGSDAVLPITEVEYTSIKNARLVIRECLYLEQKFDFLIANYVEFESALLEASVHHMVLGGQDFNWFAASRATFDRRIMNLLTTTRTYTDSISQHVNRIYGRDPSKTKDVEEYFSFEYDKRLGYRTMCALRNFVQHHGLPVHGSVYGSRLVGKGADRKFRFTVDPYLLPSELREGNFKKGVLEELESKGANIDLKFLVRDYIEGLSAAHNKLRTLINEAVNLAARILDESVSAFKTAYPAEQSLVGLAAVRIEADSCIKDELPVFSDTNEYRLLLVKKNPQHVNLTRRYVSSEITAS